MIKLTRGCVFNPVFAFRIRDGWWRLQDKNGDHITVSSDEIKVLAELIHAAESAPTPLEADRAMIPVTNTGVIPPDFRLEQREENGTAIRLTTVAGDVGET